jgi:hypothetical protein
MSVVFDPSTMDIVVETGAPRELVFDKPSNLAENERALVVIVAESSSAASDIGWTTPGGSWTQIVTEDTSGGSVSYPLVGAWLLTAGGSEPSTYTFSYATDAGTINNAIGFIIRVTGTDATFADATYQVNVQSSTSNPVAPTITTVTANAMLLAITASGDGRFLTAQDTGYPTGFTGILARVASSSSVSPTLAVAYKEQAVAGASGTATFTSLQSSAHAHRTIMFAIRPTVAAGTTNITGVSDTTPYHGQTGTDITWTNGNASQGDGEVYVCSANDPDHVSAVNQTVTAWGDTGGTITWVLDSFDYDTDLYLFMRNSDEEEDTTGFVIRRSARIFWRDNGVIDLASAAQTNISSIYWHMWSDAAMSTTVDDGTGESVDASSDIEIGPITQGSLDPNSTMEVILALYVDGTTSSHLGFLGKVALVAE